MKRGMLLLLLSVLVACSAAPQRQAVPVERQVLVVLEDQDAGHALPAGSKRGYRADSQWPVSLHARARADDVGRDHELRELDAWPIPSLGVFCVVFALPSGSDRQALIDALDGDPRVAHAQAINVFRGMTTGTYDDPLFEVQYGEYKQVLEAVHAITTGLGVRIAIVDGPVDANHADLRGQIASQVPPAPAIDPSGLRHGTAVAGVIAAAAGNGEGVVGLAPGATVSVYAGCRHTDGGVTRCTTVSLAQSIERASADGAQVINLSIAGPDDWLLERLLRDAHERGAVLVAAHSEDEAQGRFPGSLPFVHAAGPRSRSWFARQEQFSTRAGGGYQVFFGSSMSAAGVAGVAALLRAHLSPPKVRAILADVLDSGCGPVEEAEWAPQLFVGGEACAP